MRRILLIILSTIIAIPLLLIVGYIIYGFSVKVYAVHLLRKAASDAEYYDYQCYETERGAYQADFYKFSACNEDFIKDWETEASDEFIFKSCSINAGLFRPVIIINTSAKCATLEYHCTL